MKTIYLPYSLEATVRVLSYIAVFVLDFLNFLSTPITWVKFKAHVFMAAITGGYYVYLHFIANQQHAHWIAISTFLIATFSVALLKYARKKTIALRHFLMGIFYSPVGVSFRIKPVFQR